jgi:hypothetical protein
LANTPGIFILISLFLTSIGAKTQNALAQNFGENFDFYNLNLQKSQNPIFSDQNLRENDAALK